MHRLGIRSGSDLRTWDPESLLEHFGKAGRFYYQIAQGIDDRPVRSQRIRKSLSSETTYERDLNSTDEILSELYRLAAQVASMLREKQLAARTIAIKVRYDNFKMVTRAHTFAAGFDVDSNVAEILRLLLERTEAHLRPVRLLGVIASNLCDADEPRQRPQFQLFDGIQ